MSELLYSLSKTQKITELMNALPEGLKPEHGSTTNIIEYYYDTFDWRLYERNLAFVHSGKDYSLYSYNDNKKILSVKSNEIKQQYFADSFAKQMQEKIRDIIQYRALLNICRCKRKTEIYKILNEDEKTVVKLYHDYIKISNNETNEFTLNIVRMIPLRGYNKTLIELTRALLEKGFAVESENYLEFIYKHFGRVPGQYSSKIKLMLDARITTIEALRLILIKLVDVLIECENGIIDDIDIEFLHDYRVSVRNAKVILSEFKKILAPSLLSELKSIFSGIGSKTNALRDYDVSLLNKPKYESYLPDMLRNKLQPLFDRIENERMIEFRKLKRYLTSEEYKNTILQLDVLLEGDFESGIPEEANQPILQYSQKVIARRYRNILKKGRQITAESKDEELHEVRLEGKKLRYLLELFSSLFPGDEVDFLIKQLKIIQDNLGDFNDLSIQQEKMKYYLSDVGDEINLDNQMAFVIGGLITALHRKRNEVRAEFMELFTQFDSEENRKIIAKLFGK